MSGRLFQQDDIPTTPVLAKNAPYIQECIINEISVKYPNIEYVTLGSVGKKKDEDYNGDIDIGIKCENIDELSDIIHDVFDYTDTVDMKTLYIVSIKYPYALNGELKYVAVDFILVKNIEYTKFRYYCPDYRINESRYKVGTKIMYVGTILNHCIKSNKDFHYKYQFEPTGLFLDVIDVNNKKMKTDFITFDPQEITDIMFNEADPSICNSIETLWKGIHSDKFKYPEEVKALEVALFVNSYRKSWEELVKPEDFELSDDVQQTIQQKYKVEHKLRNINKLLFELQDERH